MFDEMILAGDEDFVQTDYHQWKAEVCREYEIDIFFEDRPEVVNALDDSTIAFVAEDKELGKVPHEEE